MNKDIEDFIKKRFIYFPETGQLWKVFAKSCKLMTKSKDGYIRCRVKKQKILGHRICWFLYYGYFPSKDIDHYNHITDDNRITNLSDVPRSLNIMNRGISKNNKSGYKGVYFDKNCGKYRSYVGYKGGKINLGCFDSAEDAYKAYDKKAKELYGKYAGHKPLK